MRAKNLIAQPCIQVSVSGSVLSRWEKNATFNWKRLPIWGESFCFSLDLLPVYNSKIFNATGHRDDGQTLLKLIKICVWHVTIVCNEAANKALFWLGLKKVVHIKQYLINERSEQLVRNVTQVAKYTCIVKIAAIQKKLIRHGSETITSTMSISSNTRSSRSTLQQSASSHCRD